jgi:methionyl aminopeptidase
MITIKSKEDIEIIRQNGKIVADTLDLLCKVAVPGVATNYLNDIADSFIRSQGAVSSCLGYKGFPKSICISINEEIVHGIASERKLENGQIVTFDVCVNKNGFHADAAVTIPVGNISDEAQKLIDTCKKSLDVGIESIKVGKRFSIISEAIYKYIRSEGYSVIREYGGHGIGKELHEDLFIPNYYCIYCKKRLQPEILEGMTFTLEPMISLGQRFTKVLNDRWTVVTVDSSLTAHFEHTLAIINGKAEILTKR